MSAGRRIAVLVAAVVVLAVAFVLAQGSDEGGEEQTREPGEIAQQTTPEQTGGSTAPAEPEDEAEPETGTEPAPPPPRVETIRIRGGQPVGEVQTLTFKSGDVVRLRFRSDAADEVHIHGYDRTVEVPAGGTATDRFRADAEGIFEIESHVSHALLARLEVTP